MDTNQKPIRTNHQSFFKQKPTDTPQTATSLSDRPSINQNNQISFSSIIPSVQKLFLPEQAFDESFEELSMNFDEEQKKLQVSCEQILLGEESNQNKQFKFEVVLQNSRVGDQQINSTNMSSMELIQGQQLQRLQILSCQQSTLMRVDKASSYCMVKFSRKQQFSNKLQKCSISFIFDDNKFEGQLCSFQPNHLIEKSYLQPKSLSLIKQASNCCLTVIIPYQRIIEIYNIKQQFLNKSPSLNLVKSMNELKGILFELCRQNMGSRIVQKLIHLYPEESIQVLRKQLQGRFHELIMDKYGNYVVQKVFFNLQAQEKCKFIKDLLEYVPKVSKTKFGTFCLQYILRQCRDIVACIEMLEKAVSDRITQLSCDEFATHFIQKLIQFSPNHLIEAHFFNPVNLVQTSTTKHGILTIKSVMSRTCRPTKKSSQKRIEFLNLVYSSFQALVTDEYGHFLIQQLLKYYQPHELNWVFWSFSQNIVQYATNVHSLSVIRQYLETFSQTWIGPMVFCVFGLQDTLKQLMSTKTGSFLIHFIIDMVDPFTRNGLMLTIGKVSGKLTCSERRMRWKKYIKNDNQNQTPS